MIKPRKTLRPDGPSSPRRRLNLRLLGITFAAGVVVVAGMYFLNTYQVKASARKIRERAAALESEGDNKQALRYLRQYIGFSPDDTDALVSLAGLLEKNSQDPQQQLERFLVYERILRQQPDRQEIRRKLAELALQFQRLDDARLHLKELIVAHPDDGELEFLFGQCEELAGKPGLAADRYQAAIRKGCPRVEVYLLQANLLQKHFKQPAKADALIDQMIAANSESCEAYVARAGYRKIYGSLEKALEDATRAVEIAPEKSEPLLMLAQLVRAKPDATPDQKKAAIARLEQAITAQPKDAMMYQALAELELKDGSSERAIAALRRGSEQLPTNAELHLKLADLLIGAGQTEGATREIAKLKDLKVDNTWIEYLESRLMIQRGELLAASARLRRLISQQGLPPGIRNMVRLQLGACYQLMGNFDSQLAEFEAVLESEPLSTQARFGAAMAHQSLGHTDLALAHYEKLMAVPGVPLTVARLHYQRNIRLPADQQDWTRVEQILSEAATHPEQSVETALLRAEVEQARGRVDEAQNTLDELASRNPAAPNLWTSRLQLAIQNEQWDRAESILSDAEKELGDNVLLRLTHSRYWVARGGEGAGPGLSKLAENTDAFPREEQVRLFDGLANARFSLGQTAEAKDLWIRVAKLQPDNVPAQFRLFMLALSLRDQPTQSMAAAELRRIEGADGSHTLTAEALELIERAASGDTAAADRARSILGRVASQRPGWPIVPINLARLDEISGNTDSALMSYQRAVDIGSREPAVIRRVVSLLLEKNRFQDAQRFLQQIRLDTPPALVKEAHRTVAEASLKSLDFEQAQKLARELVSTDSNDSLDQIWFGQMMAATGQMSEGKQALEKAVQIDPRKPGPWVSLILFLARTNQVAETEQIIEKARGNIPAEQLPSALALCYEALHRYGDAEKNYLLASSLKPDAPGPTQNLVAFYLRTGQNAKAEPLLRKLSAPDAKAPPAVSSWTRRILATVIAPLDYPHFQEALRLLDENKAQPIDSTADERIRARLLLLRPSKDNIEQSVRIFSELEKQGVLLPADQYVMAQALDASGRIDEGNSRWRALLSAHEGNPQFVSAYVARQMRNRNFEEARKWLAKLSEAAPNSFVTIELTARLLIVDGKLGAIFPLLAKYKDSDNPLIKEQKDRVRQIVGLLLALESDPKLEDSQRKQLIVETEHWYRELVTLIPETSVAFAMFLGQQGRTQEALDRCEQSLRTGKILEITAASLPILRASNRDEKWFERVEPWMKDAVKQFPDSPAGLVQLAELNDLRGRYKEAARIDREILKKAPGNVVALNNLAWLLAVDQKQPDEAAQMITVAIAAAGPLPTLIDTRGTVLLRKGETSKAIADFQSSLAQADTPLTRFHLAEAYWKTENHPSAKAEFDRAISAGLKPDQLHPLEKPSFEAMQRAFSGQ